MRLSNPIETNSGTSRFGGGSRRSVCTSLWLMSLFALSPCFGAIAPVASVGAQANSSSNNSVATPASSFNGVGANGIFVAISAKGNTSGSVTDSSGNTYNLVSTYSNSGTGETSLFCVYNPVVSSNMTFTYTSTSSPTYPSMAVLAVSGLGSCAVDQQSGYEQQGAGSLGASPGNITPSQGNEIWISSAMTQTAVTTGPVSNVGTMIYSAALNGGVAYSLGAAYGIETTAAAVNPSWTWTPGSQASTGIWSFPASSGGCVINTTTLPAGSTGKAYSQTIATTGCASPAFSVTSGLPPGLSMNATSGTISGTPTTAGTYTFTVNVSDTNGNPSQALTIPVTSGCSGYAYSATLSVAAVSATLTNFPVLVSLSIPAQYVLSPQGDDICISDSGNNSVMPMQWLSTTSLDGPVHEWNWQSGQANLVFNAPSLSAGGPTTFMVWAGKPFALATNPDSTSVWDTNMSMVLHLQEAAFPIVNAVSNTPASSGKAPKRATGQIGFAERFASASSQEFAAIGTSVTGGVTVSALFNTTYGGSAAEILLDGRGAMTCGTGVAPIVTVENGALQCSVNGTLLSGTAAVNDGNWHYLACTSSPSGSAFYVDGSQVASNGSGLSASISGMTAGGACNGGNYFDGRIEEVRMAAASGRPAAWIAAEAANLLHPSTFVTIGSWSFSGPAGPAITSTGLTANSPSSLLATWTTSTVATSRVLCGTVSGGPYTYFTPLLHPVKSGASFYGVTSHSIPITGLHAATTYYCVLQSIGSNGGWTQSSELTAMTSAALVSTPIAISSISRPLRPNDGGIAPSGANGVPYTGCWMDGDTELSTWAANGVQYGQWGDGGGPQNTIPGNGTGFLSWNDPNHMCATYITLLVNTCGGPNCSNPYSDGMAWYSGGPVSVNGTLYQQIHRYQQSLVCCTSIIKTGDYWAHSTAPQDNSGPAAVGGIGLDTPTQGNAMWNRTLLFHWTQVGQDHNSNAAFANYANNDGWEYALVSDNWALNGSSINPTIPVLVRVRIEDLPRQDPTTYQFYTGAQSADDGVYDSGWSYDYTQETYLNASLSNFLSTWPQASMTFIPDFNRFVTATNPQDASGYGAGTALWDGAYPWSMARPVVNAERDYSNINYFPNFGQLLSATYAKMSSAPLASRIALSTASSAFHQNNSPAWDDYSNLIYFLTLAASGNEPSRPSVSANSRSAHVAGGLDVFYNFKGFSGDTTLKNLAPSDPAGQYNATVSGNWTCGAAVPNNFYYDQYGMYNFGYPSIFPVSGGNPWTGQCNYAITTPYSATSNAFTAVIVWGHYPASVPYYSGSITLPTASAETVLSKGTDLAIKRHGSTLNSGWDVVVGGTTVNSAALSCNDGTFCAFVVRRDGGGNVTVYRSNSIESGLPLVPDATAVVSGGWSTSPLTLGDATNSLVGVMSEVLVWHTNLTDAQLVREMGAVRLDMANRGATIQ